MTDVLDTSTARLEKMIADAPAQEAASKGVMIHPLLLAAMASELQHLRSPVTVSDEMLERAHAVVWPATEWNEGEHACREVVRAALTAALAPAEQEGEDDHVTDWQGLGLDVIEYRHKKKPAAPTHPGGESRVVAWLDLGPDGLPAAKRGTTADPETAAYWRSQGPVEPLVPLSSLEAVERERDEARQMCAKLLYAGQEDLILLQEVAGTVTSLSSRAEAAEASLAAARELEAACDALAATRSQATYLSMIDNDYATDALARLDTARTNLRAALAGSNGE